MRVSDFNYELPKPLIAQHPPKTRGTSRLLVMDKHSGQIEHSRYTALVDFLSPGDVVVMNNTKVIKARLTATNSNGQVRELFLLEDHHTMDTHRRKVLYHGKIHANEELSVSDTAIKVDEVLGGGIARISSKTSLLDLAEQVGSVPLPPYMHRDPTKEDIERYQTVFAKEPGSVAAPTASLNFTKEMEQSLAAKGIKTVYLTLHVGLGTFLPIRVDEISEHTMHSEYFEIPKQTIQTIQHAKQNSGKIVALGTTVARTLEFTHRQILDDAPVDISGEADIFIYPGYNFNIVDALLTNFHAPKTTVLMLAAAFAGWQNLECAYKEAIKENYAFLSYGDSMMIY
jgi:S-adenosylmethionine:tRNA ribosyltransferase-isomerase